MVRIGKMVATFTLLPQDSLPCRPTPILQFMRLRTRITSAGISIPSSPGSKRDGFLDLNFYRLATTEYGVGGRQNSLKADHRWNLHSQIYERSYQKHTTKLFKQICEGPLVFPHPKGMQILYVEYTTQWH
ncbi:unnamed protein product [Citrullus colocynthis]|uniref:Uncharacterized protein n=1 Tax=Citrullus colocynthis TaxID=252529 RepID=A0ABP0Z3V9_9ROSI